MDEEENDSKDEADAAHHDVGDPKEWVLAAKQTCGGDNDFLGARKLNHIIVVIDSQSVRLVTGKSLLEY